MKDREQRNELQRRAAAGRTFVLGSRPRQPFRRCRLCFRCLRYRAPAVSSRCSASFAGGRLLGTARRRNYGRVIRRLLTRRSSRVDPSIHHHGQINCSRKHDAITLAVNYHSYYYDSYSCFSSERTRMSPKNDSASQNESTVAVPWRERLNCVPKRHVTQKDNK